MSKLYVVVQSQAYFVNTTWGHGTPREGMRVMADIHHRYGIPMTWFVTPRSAKDMAEWLTLWHEKYDDAVAQWMTYPREKWGRTEPHTHEKDFADEKKGEKGYFLHASKEEMKAHIAADRDAIQKALPWAEVKIAGHGLVSRNILHALDELGFTGYGGHCWNQEGTDGLTHKGIPFNPWYINPDAQKASLRGKRGLVGTHWLALDLTSAYHSRATSIYSNDPNDTQRAHICHDRDIDFLKNFFDFYRENARENEFFYMIWHNESHEMEWGEHMRTYPPDMIDDTMLQMDEYAQYATQFSDVEFVTLPKLVAMYRAGFEKTPPTYYLAPGAKCPEPYYYPELNAIARDPGNRKPPYPETFFYYDDECYLIFEKGISTPLETNDYTKAHATTVNEVYPPEPAYTLKKVEEKSDARSREFRVRIESPNEQVSGVAFWGDWQGWRFVEAPSGSRVYREKVAFYKFHLKPGENEFRIRLTKS